MEQLAKEQAEELNHQQAFKCSKSESGTHEWFILSKTITVRSENVTEIACGRCFLRVNVQKAIAYEKEKTNSL